MCGTLAAVDTADKAPASQQRPSAVSTNPFVLDEEEEEAILSG